MTKEQLQTIVDNIELICFDTFNFNEAEKTYCPLAIAHNLHKIVINPTDLAVQMELSKFYAPVNILKGVAGEFYTKDRKKDLMEVCSLLLKTK